MYKTGEIFVLRKQHATEGKKPLQSSTVHARRPVFSSRYDLLTPENSQVPGGVASPPIAVAIF